MDFVNGFPDVGTIFRTGSGDRLTRENWGITSQMIPSAETAPTQKRRKSTSILAKKRAKMTRSDENIIDPESKKVAVEILDQIQDTPGVISLNWENSQSAGLVPIPVEFLQVQQTTNWSIDSCQEGQLNSLLAQRPERFASLGLAKLEKGAVETKILPRQMPLKEALSKLTKTDKSEDDYTEFGSAVVNLLRRMDAETANQLTQSIAVAVENEINNVMNK